NFQQCSEASTFLLATAKPIDVHQIARQGCVIPHFREHVSTAVEYSGSWLSYSCSQLLPLCYNTTTS
ncbi:unnamed protein product, partial [Staurois parvus]